MVFIIFSWFKIILFFLSYSLCQQHGPASRKERNTHRQQGKRIEDLTSTFTQRNNSVCKYFVRCNMRMKHMSENFFQPYQCENSPLSNGLWNPVVDELPGSFSQTDLLPLPSLLLNCLPIWSMHVSNLFLFCV